MCGKIRRHQSGMGAVESVMKGGGGARRRKNSVAMRFVAWTLTRVGSVMAPPDGRMYPMMPEYEV